MARPKNRYLLRCLRLLCPLLLMTAAPARPQGLVPIASALNGSSPLPSSYEAALEAPEWPSRMGPGLAAPLEEIEHIDPRFGTLGLRIPLGLRYPLGPRLSYRFELIYRSDFLQKTEHAAMSSDGSRLFIVPENNAGLGWQLHLGLLRPAGGLEDSAASWVYTSPRGESHAFFPLPGYPLENDQGLKVYYTQDGSRLRLQQRSQNRIRVEAPDGTSSWFDLPEDPRDRAGCAEGSVPLVEPASGPEPCWRFLERRDPYGNRLWVEYSRSGEDELWTIRDSTGRHHALRFTTRPWTPPEDADQESEAYLEAPADASRRRLLSLDLAAFGGQRAVYELAYEAGFKPSRCGRQTQEAQLAFEPLLKRIRIPASQDYEFLSAHSPLEACAPETGRLVEMTLPSGGRIAYSYQPWPASCEHSSPQDATAEEQALLSGIAQRKIRLPRGPVGAVTTYRPTLLSISPGPDPESCQRVRQVTIDGPVFDGTFRRDVLYTTLPGNPPFSGSEAAFYAFPLNPQAALESSSGTPLFLSQEIYDCLANQLCDPSRRQRSIYVRYAAEELASPRSEAAERSAPGRPVHPRLVARRTVFHDDGDRFFEEERSHFDGAGTPRRRRWRDNFNGAERVLEEEIDTTATGATVLLEDTGAGRLHPPAAPESYLPGPDAPWILHPIRRRTLRLGEDTRVEEWIFDRGGLPVCRRAWQSSAGRGPRDIVRREMLGLVPGTDAGLAVLQILAGGDRGELPVDTLCPTSGAPGRGSRFVETREYRFMAPAFAENISSLERAQILPDLHTGLPARRIEATGEITAYRYDVLGRLEEVAPDRGLDHLGGTVKYRSPAGGPPSVDVTFEADGELWDRRVLILDPFGRPRELRDLQPSPPDAPDFSIRKIGYDALGRRRWMSQPSSSQEILPQERVSWGRYDPFGRPRLFEPASGEAVTLSYSGARRVDAAIPLRLRGNAFDSIRLRWRFDPWGRPEGAAGTRLATRWVHGAAGEVLQTLREGTDTTAAEEEKSLSLERQGRSFLWDGRGFLTRETHPELGSEDEPSGRILWQRDAKGRALGRLQGELSWSLELDPLGRRHRLFTQEGKILETLWGSVDLPGDRRRGRIVRATRWTRELETASWRVTETDSFSSSRPEPTFRRTDIQRSPGEGPAPLPWTFEQSWELSPYGTPQRWSHPAPASSKAPMTASSATVAEVSFSGGLPVRWLSASGPLAELEYHPDETPRRIRWGNGVLAQRTLPAVDSHRYRIFGPDGGLLRDSEGIHRDFLGFRWADGPERFVYDGNGRLVIAAQRRVCAACRLELAYDPFDNLTNIYRDERFDWWLEVDSKNRLRKPPGDDLGEVTYDSSGRVAKLRWSWTTPPPALQSLTFDYDSLGDLNRVRAGPGASPYRDWILIPGPGGRPAAIFEARTGVAHLALRDLKNRPLSLWTARLPQTPSSPSDLLQLRKELFYGPHGLLAESSPRDGLRYLLQDEDGTLRFASDSEGKPAQVPLFYPFGRRLDPPDADPSGGSGKPEAVAGPRGTAAEAVEPTLFGPSFAGHEALPEGLTLSPEGRPYAPQLSRFLTPGREAGVWTLYGLVPPQIARRTALNSLLGPGELPEHREERIWHFFPGTGYEGLDLPLSPGRALDRPPWEQ